MNLRLAVIVAASLFACAAGPAIEPALAQSPWPEPAQQAPAPWPGQKPSAQAAPQEPWPTPPQQQGGAAAAPWPQQQARPAEPPCMTDFSKLRDDAAKKASAIQTAGKRKQKPSAKEACGLFNSFSKAEAKMIKFVEAKSKGCGIPPEVLDHMQKAHAKTTEIRTRVCKVAAAGPPAPRGPSLSDALSAPVPNADNIKPGRGTFDTLTGSALGK